MLRTDTPKEIQRRDYQPPTHTVERLELRFELGEQGTTVSAQLQLVSHSAAGTPLWLDGQQLELLSLACDGRPLQAEQDYRLEEHGLWLYHLPQSCTLSSVVRIHPETNTALEGLYKSSGNFCTQCEAEGFRKITYMLDRPDVMTVYTTTLVADAQRYPVLLSNGNPIASGALDDGQHYATWHDPFPKPSYLFALVAGDLALLEDRYTTASGREVQLRIYSEPHSIAQCGFAMQSVKNALRWDEHRFGLDYDLDIYMIVAVGDFNMGAMENKGLNVFNTKYVLASPETATDVDFQGVEAVIAHEYFHNWTGNRVTCRDWFQLSLKEGLTVFRDQEFSAAMGSPAVCRIQDVRVLRAAQFAEDAGPMAHPVRPESYIEINNFYTVTVYEKGAEVVRMYQTLLGREGFRKGMELYFQRHDGQAVTCDDFRAAMADANGVDLSQFERWYAQAGTPVIHAHDHYDAASQTYQLTLKQSCPATPNQPHKLPFHIPIALGLLASDGSELALKLDGVTLTHPVLELHAAEQTFVFHELPERPLPSLLRNFSAPVKLQYDYSDQQLSFLLRHDSDAFNRWEAGQTLLLRTLLNLVEKVQTGQALQLPTIVQHALCCALQEVKDEALLAEILTPPSEGYLADQLVQVDIEALFSAREFLLNELARNLRNELLATYQRCHQIAYDHSADAMAKRALKNRCLEYLLRLVDDEQVLQLALTQYQQASNMTDELAALQVLVNHPSSVRTTALTRFYERWQQQALVVDKWFTLQATSRLPDTLQHVQTLLQHPAFTLRNPNRMRSLVGAFCNQNLVRFHQADGAGYQFWGDMVLELNRLNPQIAARLCAALSRWRRFDPARQALMQVQLQRVLAAPDLSSDVYEVVSKSLQG